MPKQNELYKENKVYVTFCDGSETVQSYNTTSWGDLECRDQYHKYVDAGKDNDKVWALFPHVTEVKIELAGAMNCAIERFQCTCKGVHVNVAI